MTVHAILRQPMTTIQKLPYIEPAKSVSARKPSSSLLEHLEAFLGANNSKAFLIEANDKATGILVQFLLDFSSRTWMSRSIFMRNAVVLHKLSNKTIKRTHAREILASLFGYKNFTEAYHSWPDNRDIIINKSSANGGRQSILQLK